MREIAGGDKTDLVVALRCPGGCSLDTLSTNFESPGSETVRSLPFRAYEQWMRIQCSIFHGGIDGKSLNQPVFCVIEPIVISSESDQRPTGNGAARSVSLPRKEMREIDLGRSQNLGWEHWK